jgi:hypothetical protein
MKTGQGHGHALRDPPRPDCRGRTLVEAVDLRKHQLQKSSKAPLPLPQVVLWNLSDNRGAPASPGFRSPQGEAGCRALLIRRCVILVGQGRSI